MNTTMFARQWQYIIPNKSRTWKSIGATWQ